MTPPDPSPEVLDARGVRCPMPVILLARLAAERPGGGTVVVRWTDPAAETDIPAWARMRGHRTDASEEVLASVMAALGTADGAGTTNPDNSVHDGVVHDVAPGWTVVVLSPHVT